MQAAVIAAAILLAAVIIAVGSRYSASPLQQGNELSLVLDRFTGTVYLCGTGQCYPVPRSPH
jgi:hypothetical protein